MKDEDELTEAERRALDALPAETRVPAGFEDRVVESLRTRGLLGGTTQPSASPPRRRVLRLGLAAGLFGSGLGAGSVAADTTSSAVWAWRYQGLFRIFAEMAIRWTGGYDSFFTLLFTFLTLFVASMLIGAVLTSLTRRQFSKDEWQTLLHDTTALLDSPWRRKG